jgi:hypothetical protein
MFFWEEDPFALHVVIYSCDRLIMDYAKKKNIFVTFDWKDYIQDEYHQLFHCVLKPTIFCATLIDAPIKNLECVI